MLRTSDDVGETLVEVLVTLVILSIAAVAILTGVQTAVRASDITRKEATSGTYVHGYAEAIENFVSSSGHYVDCAGISAYGASTVGYAVPSGYSAAVTTVQYWSGSAWTSPCGSDQGAQQLTLTVSSSDSAMGGHGATEVLTIVIRKPCIGTPGATAC